MTKSSRIFLLMIVAARMLPTSRAEAHEGWGIVVDLMGRVYFGDIPANIIWRISKEGKLERVALGKHSHALVLDSAGNVYGTNPHLTLPIRSVWRLTPDGRLTDIVSPTEHFPLGLQSFIMDDAGNMYSVNARNAQTAELLLLKRRPDGEITMLAGSTVGYADGIGTQTKFMGIDGMAWAPDGALYVADGSYVRRVALDGTVTTLGAGPLTERQWDEDLLGIAVNTSGEVYVADHAKRRILHISPAGAVRIVLRTGPLWTPTGIAVASDGLYVLEHLRMPLAILGDLAIGPYIRVRRVSGDGGVTVLARIWGSRSFTAGTVMAVFGVIVGAMWIHLRRKPPNTPLQPTSGAGTPSTPYDARERRSRLSGRSLGPEARGPGCRNRALGSQALNVKNIQVIDGALNCVYDVFAATDREFSSIFPPGTNVAFIDEVLARHPRAYLDAVFSRIWARPIRKAAAHGIHGTLFYELAGKKPFFPTRRDEEAVNPDGSLLRRPHRNRARAGGSRTSHRTRPGGSRSGA